MNDDVAGLTEKDDKGEDTKYAEFIKKYKAGELYDEVSILISEWANMGDFLDFLRKNYSTITLIQWKVFLFQIISTLAVIQFKFPAFRHNDMKANNILIHKFELGEGQTINVSRSKYKVCGKTYRIPKIGYQLKLWDFDFACIPGIVDNEKVSQNWTKNINVTPVQNRYYDIHYFFNTLLRKGFIPDLLTNEKVPIELKQFMDRIIPMKYRVGKYVHKRGRILINEEYIIPEAILSTDPFFAEFRDENNIKKTNINNKNMEKEKNQLQTKKTSKKTSKNNVKKPSRKTSKNTSKNVNTKISNIKNVNNIDNINLGDLLSD